MVKNYYWRKEYFKKIDKQKVLKLKEEVAYQKGKVVSKTLAQDEALNVTFFLLIKEKKLVLIKVVEMLLWLVWMVKEKLQSMV